MDAPATIRLSRLSSRKEGESPTFAPPSSNAAPSAEVSDEVLLLQVAKGSREALSMLFRRYSRPVRSVAYRALRNSAEADDLVQDSFLLIARNAKTFDAAKGSARTWILQIAHRRGISRHRYLASRHFYSRIGLEVVSDELGDPRASELTENPIGEAFGDECFRRAFEQLSFDQRETLRLYFFEGCSLDEIAVKLGQSRGNIKHHYFRGLERLRKKLFVLNG